MALLPDRLKFARPVRGPLDVLFVVLALGFAAAALYHAAAIVAPSIAGQSPAWRHGLFVLINGLVGLLFLRRPVWFACAFALLATQQLYSHGTAGWSSWSHHHRVDWASVLVVLAMPLVALLLGYDARRNLRAPEGGLTHRGRE
jgi:hypothetical protein